MWVMCLMEKDTCLQSGKELEDGSWGLPVVYRNSPEQVLVYSTSSLQDLHVKIKKMPSYKQTATQNWSISSQFDYICSIKKCLLNYSDEEFRKQTKTLDKS